MDIIIKVRLNEEEAVTLEHARSLAAAWVTKNIPPIAEWDWYEQESYSEKTGGRMWIVEYRLAPDGT